MELDPRTTAVVAVHCQGDIVGPTGAFADFFHQQVTVRHVIDQIAALIAAARTAAATVVYTRVAWKPDFSDLEVNSPLLGIVAQSGCLKEGSELAEIVEPLAPHGGDIVLTHQRIGAFARTDLDTVLREKGITTLVFAGVATNASVEGTARVASDLGYRVVIVEDACSAATPAAHHASIDSLGLLAEISTVDEVRTALTATVTGTRA